MTAPNIVNVGTITGKTAVQAITTSATAIVINASNSGKLTKVNSLTIANVDGSSSVDVTVDLFRSSTAYRLAYLYAVVAKQSAVIIGKDNPIYLEEGDSLRVTASANSDAEAVCSYEDIS